MSEVVELNQGDASAPSASTPMEMLNRALDGGADIETLDKLMSLQERWEATQAKRSYIAAFAAFKKGCPDVVNDLLNKQYDSDYSSLANLVNTVSKAMGEYGLSARWSIDQGDKISVTCILSHCEGHFEKVTLSGLPDDSGKKNGLQQIKSTLTYLEGATFQAVTGVVSKSACKDDDGFCGGAPKAFARVEAVKNTDDEERLRELREQYKRERNIDRTIGNDEWTAILQAFQEKK